MWQNQQQADQNSAEQSDKQNYESSAGDSGFISSGDIYSSELSSKCFSEEMQSTSIQSSKAMDSDNDLGLADNFNQLSLKQTPLNQLDSSKAATSYDSGIISMTSSSDIVENSQSYEEPWKLYYTQDEDGDTLLHAAVIQGFFEATLSLINIAPDPKLLDILNDDNLTALHLAVLTNQPKIVRSLVLAGANVTIRNFQGNTALHLACVHNKLDCAEALLEPISQDKENVFGSKFVPQNLELRNYCGQTALHIAAVKNHLSLVKLLVKHKANIESKETLSGRTALHLALEGPCLEVFNYLIYECRPDLAATTYAGYAVYDIANCVDRNLAHEIIRVSATPKDDETDDLVDLGQCGVTLAQA